MTTQGVGGKASGSGISLRGGGKVRRFVANAGDSGRIARLTAKSVKRRVMPGYRRDLPVKDWTTCQSCDYPSAWEARGAVRCWLRTSR